MQIPGPQPHLRNQQLWGWAWENVHLSLSMITRAVLTLE